MVKRDKFGRFTKECVGKENPFYGRYHKEETKIEHKKVIEQKWKQPGYKENQIKKRKGKHSSPKTEFKKGHIPKNPIKKGEHRSSATEFKKGQKCWNKGLTKETDERIRKYVEKMKLNLNEEEIIRLYKEEKLSSYKISKKFNCSSGYIINILKKNNIKIYPSGFFHKGKTSWKKNKKDPQLTKRNLKNWKDPTYRNKILSDEMLKRRLKGLLKRPTSFEQKISDLCIKYHLPFIYSGDGRFLINFKNPDFVNEKNKIVIEVFYSWFKIRDYGSVENYKEFCRRKYESKGWKVIFIDELDLSHENWEEVCLKKIEDFK